MSNLELLSASIRAEKKFADVTVDKAVNDTFGSRYGASISRSLSTRYRGGAPDFLIKQSIERLGALLSNSTPDASDCREYEKVVLQLKKLLKSREEENFNLQSRLKELLDEKSPSQSRHVNNLLEEIRQQGDEIRSLETKIDGIHQLQEDISDKESELKRMEEVVAKRDETILNIHELVERRVAETGQIREDLKITQEAFESFKKSSIQKNNLELAQALQQHLKDLDERESRVIEINQDKQILDDRVKSLEEELKRAKSSGPTLEEVSILKKEGSRLLKEAEEKSKTITTMESTLNFLNDKIYDTTAKLSSSETRNKRCEHDKKIAQDMNQSLKDSRDDCLSSTKVLESEMDQLRGQNEDLVNEISGLKNTLRKNEVIDKATGYLLSTPKSRNPTDKRLRELYGTRFMIQRTRGSGSYSPMTIEPSSGIVNKSDLKIFSDLVFRDNYGDVEIIVKNDKGTHTPLSLKSNISFDTWRKVRGSNTCKFLISGNSDEHSIRQKEFLLLLYIIHIEGLYGNHGDLLINPGQTGTI